MAAVVALGVSLVCGLITATLVALFGMSPIIVTLGGLAAARGVAEVVSRGETVFGFGSEKYFEIEDPVQREAVAVKM